MEPNFISVIQSISFISLLNTMSNHSQLRLKKVRLGSVTRRLSYGSKSRGFAVEEFGTNYPYKKVSGHDTAFKLNEFYVLHLCVCFPSLSCKI